MNKIPLPKVDQRVELLSIVFRLAGSNEYNTLDNLKYVQTIHQHFDKFITHPLIKFAAQMRDSNAVGYDAVMSMAIHLQQPPSLNPITPFSNNVPDKRWKIGDANKFVKLLQDFYKDADCESFFKLNADYYNVAEKSFLNLFNELDVSWYYKYYGKAPKESFNIIIGLGNGGNNFGPKISLPDQTEKVYAIIGSDTFDSTGKPIFESQNYLPTLIHEFNHSFINYLTDKYKKSLTNSGQIIFDKENIKMRKQAYGNWETMFSESLVRASVVIYLAEHMSDSMVADKELKEQLARGFVWTKELVGILKKYEKNRTRYPTLESYMPEIVNFYDSIAPKINSYDDRYLQQCAKVISVQPFRDNDTLVSPSTKQIQFHFDKKLDGVRYFFGPGKSGIAHYPTPVSFAFSNDNKTIVMTVELKPNTEYQINLIGSKMRTDDNYSVQNYLLNFKTGDK